MSALASTTATDTHRNTLTNRLNPHDRFAAGTWRSARVVTDRVHRVPSRYEAARHPWQWENQTDTGARTRPTRTAG